MKLRSLHLALAALMVTGCQKPAPRPQSTPQILLKQPPSTPIEKKKEELGGNIWDTQWNVFIERSLPPSLLSAKAARAVRSYCPRFAQESEPEKRAFWAYTFQALAGAEAGLNPTSDVHHTQPAVDHIDRVTRHATHQEGLLQLTYQDAQRYDCPFDYARDRTLPEKDPARTILQPTNNLACGLKIMEHQIIIQSKPLISRTSYWATLQPGTLSHRIFARQMTNVPAACRLEPGSTASPVNRALTAAKH